MAYPFDGEPNLRPGAERVPVSLAPRYDPALSLDELFEDFLAGSASVITDKTERTYRCDWGLYRTWLDETGQAAVLGTITKQHLVDYIAYLQRRPKAKGQGTLSSHSVHHYVRVVRTCVRWLVDEGYYPGDPLAGGKRGPMPRLGPRVLKIAKKADVEMLLEGASNRGGRNRVERATRSRDELIVWLVTDTGIRTGEVVRLRIGEVDLDDGWLLIEASKWDRQRRVSINRETIATLRLYLRRDRPVLSATRPDETNPHDALILSRTGEALTPQGAYQAMGRAYRRGGGTGRFGLHRLRHLWGTTAAERGMHPAVSQQLMGHEDAKSQLPYQHPSDETKKRQHAQVTPIRDIRPARRRRLA